MNSEAHDHEGPSPHHHRRRNHRHRRCHLLLSLAERNRQLIIILSATAVCICYISHLHHHLHLATQDLYHHQTFTAKCAAPIPSSLVRRTVIDRIFNGTSPWENFPPAHVARFLHNDLSVGWGSSDDVFEHLIREVRPKTIIEVGTFLGESAVHVASLTDKLGLDAQIVCIDDFRGWAGTVEGVPGIETVNGDSVLMYQFMRNVVEANMTDSVMFLPFSTKEALGGLCEWGVYGDLVEVDAGHDFHSAWADINDAYKVLRPGGVIFGHDYLMDGVGNAVHIFARLHGLRVQRDGDHWVMR